MEKENPLEKLVTIQDVNNFELPPALAGEKGINMELALAKVCCFWLKPIQLILISFLQLKLEAIYVLKIKYI